MLTPTKISTFRTATWTVLRAKYPQMPMTTQEKVANAYVAARSDYENDAPTTDKIVSDPFLMTIISQIQSGKSLPQTVQDFRNARAIAQGGVGPNPGGHGQGDTIMGVPKTYLKWAGIAVVGLIVWKKFFRGSQS